MDMYDEIKNRVDLQQLLETLLGKGKAGNGYVSYKCPFHQEENGRSLICYKHHWECYGACKMKGDQITFVEHHFSVSHKGAVQWLVDNYFNGNRPTTNSYKPQQKTEKRQKPVSEPPPIEWQNQATAVKNLAIDNLHSKDGKRALDYLLNRGLTISTIIHAEIGYIPGHYTEWKKLESLNVPCGITIPWTANGEIWGIKVRRASGDIRYHQIGGGNIKGCLFRADEIEAGRPIVFSEGEFDSLIVWQSALHLVNATCLGSSSNTSINRRWYPLLATSPLLISAMDSDKAGQDANNALIAISNSFKPIIYPDGMDANEFYLSISKSRWKAIAGFSQWLESQIHQLKEST